MIIKKPRKKFKLINGHEDPNLYRSPRIVIFANTRNDYLFNIGRKGLEKTEWLSSRTMDLGKRSTLKVIGTDIYDMYSP